jgi:hypothetical protein
MAYRFASWINALRLGLLFALVINQYGSATCC